MDYSRVTKRVREMPFASLAYTEISTLSKLITILGKVYFTNSRVISEGCDVAFLAENLEKKSRRSQLYRNIPSELECMHDQTSLDYCQVLYTNESLFLCDFCSSIFTHLLIIVPFLSPPFPRFSLT